MFKPIKHIVVFLICATFFLNSNGLLFAQEEVPQEVIKMASGPQPQMQNVFYNVLWGSVAGGMVAVGWAVLDDGKEKDERYGLSNLTRNFIMGATYGGIVGLFSGVYFSINGIEFDESRSRIAKAPQIGLDLYSNQYVSNFPVNGSSVRAFKADEIPIASFNITF